MANTARTLDIQEPADNIIEFPKKRVCNKKKGKKSEVYPYEIEDVKKLLNWFAENKMWTHYLALTLGINMARRIGDTLNLTWEHFFDPTTGDFRYEIMEIIEDKTDKMANPLINDAVKAGIRKYIEETGCDVTANNYRNPVFMQLTGTHRGNVVTSDAHRKALKKGAEAVGIKYNIGTHSARKTFGKISRMIHPNDYDSMEILQTVFNHSDTKTTKHYIGLTKQKVNEYYNDIGNFFGDYVTGDKAFKGEENKPTVTLEWADLRGVLATLTNNVDDLNAALELLEQLAK